MILFNDNGGIGKREGKLRFRKKGQGEGDYSRPQE